MKSLRPRLHTEEYIDHGLRLDLVAEHLQHGSLALVLGAGASAGMGLPNWKTLVQRCLEAASIPFDPRRLERNPSAEQLGLLINDVETRFKSDPSAYHALVSEMLYKDVNLGTDICKADLLIALGALMMGSRRGSVREVVTFNFDIVLEYYLSLHGYAIHTFDSLPQLKTSADVRIAHINGVLQHPAYPLLSSSEQLVFSARSMHNRNGTSVDAWREYFEELLSTHLVLFVGISGSDPIIFPKLSVVDEIVREDRVTGVWLFGKDIDTDPDAVYRTKDFINYNVVPVCKPSYGEIPGLLLEVCRRAADLV